MGRPVLPYEPTWLDREFRKAFEKLPPKGKEEHARRLTDLIAALQQCIHPLRDPRLAPWRPSPYKGVVHLRRGQLVEYRFPGTMRVIACCFESRETILLVTVTLKHDHERMKRLIKEHRSGLDEAPDESRD